MDALLDGLIKVGGAALAVGVVVGLVLVIVMLAGRAPLRIRPSLLLVVFLGPATALVFLGFVVPALRTAVLSLVDAEGSGSAGLENYAWALAGDGASRFLLNTALWSVLVPMASTVLGLVLALLVSRSRRIGLTLALVLMPSAISYVGASIAWGITFDHGRLTQAQPWSSFSLMLVMIWVQVGFATIILTAAIRGIPADLVEAARLDGATGWSMLTRVILPILRGTLIVVFVTVMAISIKVFDIVRILTNGRFGTQVMANEMVNQAFTQSNSGRGSALAVLLLIAVGPLIAYRLARLHEERTIR